jgi:hypothetical protein
MMTAHRLTLSELMTLAAAIPFAFGISVWLYLKCLLLGMRLYDPLYSEFLREFPIGRLYFARIAWQTPIWLGSTGVLLITGLPEGRFFRQTGCMLAISVFVLDCIVSRGSNPLLFVLPVLGGILAVAALCIARTIRMRSMANAPALYWAVLVLLLPSSICGWALLYDLFEVIW